MLKTHRQRTVEQVRLLDGTAELDVESVERYDFVARTLTRLGYARFCRADEGVVRQFLAKMTELSRATPSGPPASQAPPPSTEALGAFATTEVRHASVPSALHEPIH